MRQKSWLWACGLTVVSSVLAFSFGGCTSETEPLDLTSLRRSGEATFVCIGYDGQGAPLELCPQGPRTNDFGLTVGAPGYELHSLVTQTLSAEIAVIKVSGMDPDNREATSGVLDADPTNPGVTPLRVGGHPTGITTTPGGMASFVGVGEVGLEGIYALPTTCLFVPPMDQSARDLTSWPACSLPSEPGDMVVLIDTAEVDGQPREWCSTPPDADLPWAPPGSACAVDLTEETADPGRRKLLVALPKEGKLVVLDAQEILDREIGTYGPCHIEAELPLSANVPDQLYQALPDDLSVGGEGGVFVYDQLGGDYLPHPSGMDERDGLVIVADHASPVVHRIDARDACAPSTLSPFYLTSLLQPGRVVTSSRVAISPQTPTGGQYVYAIDEIGNQLSSVAIFDISEGTYANTPLVRPYSSTMPLESPDRIEFSSAVKDVAFVYQDRPIASPATGVGATGTACDPDPDATGKTIAAEYRPTSNDDLGARPGLLRGLFGYALLSNGNVAIVDIEDLDAPCRRPVTANHSSTPDFRGCFDDTIDEAYYTTDGNEDSSPTVTEEASCSVVTPHRARSLVEIKTEQNGQVNAPSLRAFGRLSQDGRGLAVSRLTPEGKSNPIMLGVDFEAPSGSAPAQVYVGSTLYVEGAVSDPLVIDPHSAEVASATLPFYQPRAYPADEVLSVIYEGILDRTQITGLLDEPVGQGAAAQARFEDPNNSFCAQGVQDRAVTREVGEQQFGLSSGALERFVDRYTDYLQIANYLFKENDPYWDEGGATCGQDLDLDDSGYVLCDSVFGEGDEDELEPSRDLSVVSAFRDHLNLTPRVITGDTAEEHLSLINCCFPQTLVYRLRAGHQWVVKGSLSGLENVIVPGEEGACVRDDSPFKSRLRSRAFELSNITCPDSDPESPDSCGVGLRTNEDVVCSYDATNGPVRIGGVASECIFDGLTRRFAIYRGLQPSERDMAFGFEVVGGFRGDQISLTNLGTSSILPVSISPVPTFGALGVVDSQNRGLIMIDVENSDVAWSFY